MAPCTPTRRPWFTATRLATAVVLVSMISSLALLTLTPADAVSGTAVACAAPLGGLR